MNLEKKRAFIINTIYFLLVSIIILVVIKYGLMWLMPFLIGFLIAFILKPCINFLVKKTKINRKIISVIVLLFVYGVIGTSLTFLIITFIENITDIFSTLPGLYQMYLEPLVYEVTEKIDDILFLLDESLVNTIKEIVMTFSEALGSIVSGVSSGLINFFTATISTVPNILISTVFAIISSFFFTTDYQKITSFVLRQLPERPRDILFDIRDYTVGTIFNFVKAYAILMSITFIELSVGFLILGVEDFITIAALIALFDVLPLLGTGGVMIPWIVFEFLTDNIYLGIGLTILFVLVTIVRNIIEPNIVGDKVGLHPLIMLICMFSGVKIFGFAGMFILPITIIVFKNLNETGKIKVLK